MSDSNKIPFGLRESDNALVDVYDVPNGKQSGCVCPSCQTPLEARQGDINVWHFAHSSKKVYQKTKNECEYSFYLSVRLMARQLIGKQIILSLPECKGTIEYYCKTAWKNSHLN
jgi:competence CoiA-like predicted nuclease